MAWIGFKVSDAEEERLDFEGIARAALAHSDALVRKWLPEGRMSNGEWVALNPHRMDNNLGSFRINLGTGRWADFASGDSGGDLISLAAFVFAISNAKAARLIKSGLGV